MSAHKKKSITTDEFRRKLKVKHLAQKARLSAKHPKVEKFFKERGIEPEKIREHSAKILGAGAITGALLLSPPYAAKALPSPQELVDKLKSGESSIALKTPQELLVETLSATLPEKPRSLARDEEKYLEQLFKNIVGVNARATLEGEHLNTTYGFIGAEQHIRRYPGDTLWEHLYGDNLSAGIAPGLGAWGYFAPSKSAMNKELEGIERWYAVVQTLYLPDWNKRQPYLKDWYKYRKVLIVNSQNANAVVASIADSGPAVWTGKHFGGSPEVMQYLGGPRYKKGPVIVFFIDDPENEVPLGPIDYNKQSLLLRSRISLPEVALHEI